MNAIQVKPYISPVTLPGNQIRMSGNGTAQQAGKSSQSSIAAAPFADLYPDSVDILNSSEDPEVVLKNLRNDYNLKVKAFHSEVGKERSTLILGGAGTIACLAGAAITGVPIIGFAGLGLLPLTFSHRSGIITREDRLREEINNEGKLIIDYAGYAPKVKKASAEIRQEVANLQIAGKEEGEIQDQGGYIDIDGIRLNKRAMEHGDKNLVTI
jgi:hypothetical protein